MDSPPAGKQQSEVAATTPTISKQPPKPSESEDALKVAELLIHISELEHSLDQESKKLNKEKDAKRKLYSSLVKLAKELKKQRVESRNLLAQAQYASQAWYEGGMWRAPSLLPGVEQHSNNNNNDNKHSRQSQRARLRESIGLSELFFNLVIVTAFTRVGMNVSQRGRLTLDGFLYFAVVWMIWTKDVNYSTRFDSTDLFSQLINLLTCFATLFGSLSMQSSIDSVDGTRIMGMAAFVALLHFILHVRIAVCYRNADDLLGRKAKNYAVYASIKLFLEVATWVVGIVWPFTPFANWPYLLNRRWVFFVGALAFSMRVPGAFLANDFHGEWLLLLL